MAYAQLDVHFDEHPKFRDLELEHLGLLACAISYANRLLTDGFVPMKAVRGFGKSSARGLRVARKLVASGLLVEVEGGFSIVGFLDHNPSREQVSERHKRHKERQTKYRNNKKNTSESVIDGEELVTRHQGVTLRVTRPSPIRVGDASILTTDPDPTTDPNPTQTLPAEPPTSSRPGVASVGGFGFENRRPEADERVANADSSPATGPQSSLCVTNVGRPTTDAETQSWGDCERIETSPSGTASPGRPEGSERRRIFEDGTAGMTELCAVYGQAVATATKQPFALPPDRSSRQALATAVNTHLRGDGTARGALAQLAPAVTQWVGQYRDRSAFTAGWAPRKFLDWLNAGRADPKAAVAAPEQPKREVYYLTGDEP